MGCGGSREGAVEPVTKAKDVGRDLQVQKTTSGGTLVMGKYEMHMGRDDIMGEGTSSVCRRGTNMQTGVEVAIKVYKDQKGGGKVKGVTMQKFKRQIAVLKELTEPFKKPEASELWHEQLGNVKPSRIFMQLLDYSQGPDGQPAPDPTDGMLYVVTELAQYSLKDFLGQRREQNRKLSPNEVRNIAKAIIIAMAGLHAKGFVHIDMKPENLMMFSGRLKVIDVDGCVRAGTKVSIHDSSISFSPCYCAPEWARFLIKDNQPSIIANPSLDVWSVGMTLCELVSLDAILKPHYANFLRNASSHKEAGFLFMEWLSSVKKAPVPRSLEKFDPQFSSLISTWLLVPKDASRKSCAQCLSHPYLQSASDTKDPDEQKTVETKPGEAPIRRQRDRPPDESADAPIHKGTLWKLNSGADPKDPAVWIKRDMWISNNHSLCYFSVKEDKRLVLFDGMKLSTGRIEEAKGCAKEFAFKVETTSDADDHDVDVVMLACESAEELKVWVERLSKTGSLDMVVTMKLGEDMAAELNKFKLTVKNRRIKVDEGEQYEPAFKEKLWKLKTEGDRTKADDWFLREMWVAKNGSLVYFSPKDDRDLVYYTPADVSRAKLVEIPDGEASKPHAFKIILPPAGGVEFSPGEFAASSVELRKKWMAELSNFIS